MKSFLIKDFILLKQRKSFFMVYFLMIVAMIYTKNIVFFIDYFSILAMILAFSTMSYDSHDNGMVFLMTMPNARKNYARAKYALCGILLLASWVVPYLVKVVSSIKEYNMINIADILLDSIIIMPIWPSLRAANLLMCAVWTDCGISIMRRIRSSRPQALSSWTLTAMIGIPSACRRISRWKAMACRSTPTRLTPGTGRKQ